MHFSGSAYHYLRDANVFDPSTVRSLDVLLNPEKLGTDAGVPIRSNIFHIGWRFLLSALFDTQNTFDEIKSFSVKEHTDRALSDGFLRTKLKRTVWETIVLSTALGILYAIGRSNDEKRKRREIQIDWQEEILNGLSKAADKYL